MKAAGGTDCIGQDVLSQQQERQARRQELGLTLRDAAAAGDVQTLMYCLSRQGLGASYSAGKHCGVGEETSLSPEDFDAAHGIPIESTVRTKFQLLSSPPHRASKLSRRSSE